MLAKIELGLVGTTVELALEVEIGSRIDGVPCDKQNEYEGLALLVVSHCCTGNVGYVGCDRTMTCWL